MFNIEIYKENIKKSSSKALHATTCEITQQVNCNWKLYKMYINIYDIVTYDTIVYRHI